MKTENELKPEDTKPEKPHNYLPELIMAICGLEPDCYKCHKPIRQCQCDQTRQ